jgi:hypothetical protein
MELAFCDGRRAALRQASMGNLAYRRAHECRRPFAGGAPVLLRFHDEQIFF